MIHPRFSSFLFITIVGLSYWLSSCDSCKPPPPPPTSKVDTINQINFFLETSASMGGYLKGKTEFNNIVTELVNKSNQIEPVRKPLAIYTISTKPTAFSGGVTVFLNDLARIPLASGKSSELHTIFRQVGDMAKQNNIAILVSDCILSFPDAAIKQDPNINVNKAESTLKNYINDEFNRLRKDSINATVYAYTSVFNGPYFDYQNNKPKLQPGESRPFYVWVIGKQGVLSQFNQKLQARLTNKPDKQLDFGGGSSVNNFTIFYELNRKGEWDSPDGQQIGKLKDVSTEQPAEFSIGVDLSGLPAYAQTDAYLDQNLSVSVANTASVKRLSVKKRESIPASLGADDAKTLSAATHVLTFRVTKLLDAETPLTITLPLKYDTWYIAQSTMDDRTPAGRTGKTFALEHLMNGVREAYESDAGADKAFLKLVISLNQ